MPYDMRNPGMNPGHEMSHDDMKKKLEYKLDEIFSYLARGKKFHYNNSFGLRNMGLRGFANLHDEEAICDFKSMVCLKKLINDRLKWNPTIDEDIAKEYEHYNITNMQEFKNSFQIWQHNETELEDCISETLKLASMEDLCLYKSLIELGNEVQTERFRSEQIFTRLELGGWQSHDLAIVSMMVHKHLEDHNNLDFTLG